jgi:hypothetical protein
VRPVQRTLSFVLILLAVSVVNFHCQTREEAQRDQARLDSLRQDSLRPVNNPYKLGQGNDQYDRNRETLGNLDSLVTPPQPSVPGH